MTDCIAQLAFSFHKKRRVVADFSGGHLTSDAGLLPLRELDHRLGWTAAAARLLTDGRDPAKVTHETTVLLRQRLFALAAGYRDANDHSRLRTARSRTRVRGGPSSRPWVARRVQAALVSADSEGRPVPGAYMETSPAVPQQEAPEPVFLRSGRPKDCGAPNEGVPGRRGRTWSRTPSLNALGSRLHFAERRPPPPFLSQAVSCTVGPASTVTRSRHRRLERGLAGSGGTVSSTVE